MYYTMTQFPYSKHFFLLNSTLIREVMIKTYKISIIQFTLVRRAYLLLNDAGTVKNRNILFWQKISLQKTLKELEFFPHTQNF